MRQILANISIKFVIGEKKSIAKHKSSDFRKRRKRRNKKRKKEQGNEAPLMKSALGLLHIIKRHHYHDPQLNASLRLTRLHV